MHAGQADVEALEAVGQSLVVDAEAVQDGGVEVVQVDAVVLRVVAKFVGTAVDHAGLDAAAGQAHGEAVRVMVAPIALIATLSHRCAPELATPHDQRFVEHPAPAQVDEQCRHALIDTLGLARQVRLQAAVLIPAHIIQLDEAHPLLSQAPRQQAVVSEARTTGLAAIQLVRGRRFATDIHHLWHAGLHAERQLVVGDARQNLRITDMFVLLPVQ